jgi:hypothetical protein
VPFSLETSAGPVSLTSQAWEEKGGLILADARRSLNVLDLAWEGNHLDLAAARSSSSFVVIVAGARAHCCMRRVVEWLGS